MKNSKLVNMFSSLRQGRSYYAGRYFYAYYYGIRNPLPLTGHAAC